MNTAVMCDAHGSMAVQLGHAEPGEPLCSPPRRRRRPSAWSTFSAWLGGDADRPSVPALPQLPVVAPPAGSCMPEVPPLAEARVAAVKQLADGLGAAGEPDTAIVGVLVGLHGSQAMARDEVRRTLGLLAGASSMAGPIAGPRLDRVATLLPGREPLYALASQVILPALLGRQVRAVTVNGPAQDASRLIFARLGALLGVTVEAAEDGSSQRWADQRLGSIALMHPEAAGDHLRLSLALIEPPNALLWTTLPERARSLLPALGACTVIMPTPLATVSVVAGWQDGSTPHLRPLIDALFADIERVGYRPGVVPDALVLHQPVVAKFALACRQCLASRHPRPPATALRLSVEPLSGRTDATALAAAGVAAREQGLNVLRVWTYANESDLHPLLVGLLGMPVVVSLHGANSVVTDKVPRDRLLLGQSFVHHEDRMERRGRLHAQNIWIMQNLGAAQLRREHLLPLLRQVADRGPRPRDAGAQSG